jgi:hypothetical protein
MKVIGVYFNPPNSDVYERLIKVFLYTIKENMPDAEPEVYKLPFPAPEDRRFQAQILKQRYWTYLALKQIQNYIIMDLDMMVMGDMSHAFRYDFDIAYTSRRLHRKPLNGGMIFCRPTAATNNFWKEWLENCEEAYVNKSIQYRNNTECKGFAQSALWYTINNHRHPVNIIDLPCVEYNACDEEWMNIDYTKIKAIHIKSRMRKSIFGPKWAPDQKVHDLWREYEKQCNSCDQEYWRENYRIMSLPDIETNPG